MRFDLFMEQCLYHPDHGYYATPGRIGRGGHYITSPELDPAFGILWASAIERVWDLCDRPDHFTLVELGPGEGGFAASMTASVSGAFADALEITLVERFPAVEEQQRQRLAGTTVTWTDRIPADIECGCVFANEVLDNQPIRVIEDGQELHVSIDGELLVEVWLPHTGDSSTAPVALATAAARSLAMGALFFVDYGYEGQPTRTLAAYGASGATSELLVDPGERDITSHVNWAGIVQAVGSEGFSTAAVITQQQALHALGLGEIDASLRAKHGTCLAMGDGAGAVRALSRRGALAALVDPSGLGRLRVLQAWRGIEGPIMLL